MCHLLGTRERKWQGCDDTLSQSAVAGDRPSGALFHLGANYLKRELIGEKFVVGEASALRRLWRESVKVGGRVGRQNRFAPTWPISAVDKAFILPFGKIRKIVQR